MDSEKSYESATQSEKFLDKIKRNPVVPLGVLGAVGMILYGVREYKNRPPTMTTSMYLMHYRVRAQGMVVGAMTIGITYQLLKEFVWDKEGHQKRLKERYAELRERNAR